MNATIKDIAREAGVSPSTVSRVVNDSPLISDNTKKKVREIMDKMNYAPNNLAMQLAKKLNFNIGFLIDTKSKDYVLDHFFYDIMGGIQSAVLSKNYELTICNMTYLDSDVNLLSRFVFSQKLAGLIAHISVLDDYIINKMNENNYPFVVIGKPSSPTTATFVDIDNVVASEMAVEHLYKTGCRKIAFICGSYKEPISIRRLKGYKNTLSSLGLPFVKGYVKYSMGTKEDGFRLMLELLKSEENIDSVICINNYTAFGALEALRKNHISVPNQISIIAFDDYPLSPYTSPPLTSINIDTYNLGNIAGELLIKKITNPDIPNESVILKPDLIIRESTKHY